jgi:hypothetical protein
VCQHRAKDVLSIVVLRHGSCGRQMSSCTLMDPLNAQEVHRLGLLPGCHGEDVLGEFST